MNKSGRMQNSIMNFATGLFGQLLITILSFASRTVFIHVLGKSYLGINGLFSNILQMLSLTELGLDTAINFKLYKPLAEHDEKTVRLWMKFYRIAYEVVGVVILILGLSLIPLLPYLINDYDSLSDLGINATLVFCIFLAKSVTSYLFFASRSAIVKADQKQYLLNIYGYFISVFTSISEIIVLYIFKSFIAYTLVALGFGIIQNFVNAFIAKKRYSYAFIKDKDSISRSEVKDVFKDLGALFVYKVNGVVIKATDNMVLSSFIGLAIVGMYSNYLILYTTIRQLLSRFYTAVKASAGNLFATGTMDQKYKYFEVMNFVSAVLYGTACIGVAVVANEFILTWIGKDYVLEQPFSILMGIEIVLVGLKLNLGQIRNISGAFRQAWHRPIIGIVINLGVSIVLVNLWGINGVLVGTISADILANLMIDPKIIYKYTFDGYRPVSEYYLRNLKYAIVLLFVGVVDYLICNTILTNMSWFSVIVHAIICAVSVPLAFFVIFRKRHESRYLIKKAKPLFKKIGIKVKL